MKEADPRLIEIPFFENNWDSRLKIFSGGLPMAEHPFEVKSPGSTQSTGTWITEFAEAQWNELFDYVLSKPSSQVFDFVDKEVFEKRRLERKWASRQASASALLSLVTFRMLEDDDILPVLQGVPVSKEYATNL